MKRPLRRPQLTQLCLSARNVLDDHLLTTELEDVNEAIRQRKLGELFAEIKRQIESLTDSSPATLAKG